LAISSACYLAPSFLLDITAKKTGRAGKISRNFNKSSFNIIVIIILLWFLQEFNELKGIMSMYGTLLLKDNDD
jgi:hypothetical protein